MFFAALSGAWLSCILRVQICMHLDVGHFRGVVVPADAAPSALLDSQAITAPACGVMHTSTRSSCTSTSTRVPDCETRHVTKHPHQAKLCTQFLCPACTLLAFVFSAVRASHSRRHLSTRASQGYNQPPLALQTEVPELLQTQAHDLRPNARRPIPLTEGRRLKAEGCQAAATQTPW